mgnify:CR=1 FL=1
MEGDRGIGRKQQQVKLYRLGKIFRQEVVPTIVKLSPAFATEKVCLLEVLTLLQKIGWVHLSRLAAKADTLVDPSAHKRVPASTLEGCVRRTGAAFFEPRSGSTALAQGMV